MVAGRAAWGDVGGDPIVSHKRTSKIVTPKDEWGTPQWLFDLLNQEFHFSLDAAADGTNYKCKGYCDPLGDSLKIDWTYHSCGGSVYLNPPYSAGNIDKFMQKAYEESLKGAVVVCLVPCATDTRWWHNYAMKAQEIRFIKGRVRFVGYDEDGNQVKNSPTFPSCVAIFKPTSGLIPRAYPWIGETIEQPKKVSGTAGTNGKVR
jgi:site-specific DNA-methyltransferase (adenine-specific)